MVREILKKVHESTSEIEIMDAMSDICNQRHYNVYEYPPPDMRRGCEAFLNDWEEVVEDAMIARIGNHLIENELCYK